MLPAVHATNSAGSLPRPQSRVASQELVEPAEFKRMNSNGSALRLAVLGIVTVSLLTYSLAVPAQSLSHSRVATSRSPARATSRGSSGSGAYAGWQACLECHQSTYSTVVQTDHARAFADGSFVAQGGSVNGACFKCHTTGGFVSPSVTPQLAGVQCESCHGAAANHAANPGDPSATPRRQVSAVVCGGCHTGAQQPTYDEWLTSEHATVTQPNMDPATCGKCHIGSARIAAINKQPLSQIDRTVAVDCATCHDPHTTQVFKNPLNGIIDFTNPLTGSSISIVNQELGASYRSQLRNPIASTNDYFLASTDSFPGKYRAGVNVCAQCHNHRGASWKDTSAPPHKSPQFNLLIGTVGELPTGAKPQFPATHSLLEKQCVACHMPLMEHAGPPAVPAITSHQFKVTSYELCAQCHRDATNAQNLVSAVQEFMTYNIAAVKAGLDEWATTKAPAALRAKYGARAWEYSTPGELSPGGPGPNKTEQALIPNNIKKARFNLYLVLNDGSYGVHNGPFATTLLDAAYDWVQAEVSP